jgi:hypothetical protein
LSSDGQIEGDPIILSVGQDLHIHYQPRVKGGPFIEHIQYTSTEALLSEQLSITVPTHVAQCPKLHMGKLSVLANVPYIPEQAGIRCRSIKTQCPIRAIHLIRSIELHDGFSYVSVPSRDARKVIDVLNRATIRGHKVRANIVVAKKGN